MTTTIQPSSGQGALYTQQGPGTTPGYSALDDRRAISGSLQEGVYGTPTQITAGDVADVAAADFMVTQRASGANMSVDINMPPGGFAWVQGDTIAGQGLYTVPVHSATINEAIAAADVSNPRVDQVILEVQDDVLDASGGNLSRTRVLTGAPTAGATLTNRLGTVALPGSALLLADVLVSANAMTILSSAIRDRRKWSRGSYLRIKRLSNAAGNSDYSTSSPAVTAIDSVNLSARLECAGLALIRAALRGRGNAGAGINMGLTVLVDGASPEDASYVQLYSVQSPSGGSTEIPVAFSWDFVVPAGSHQFQPAWSASGASSTLYARATLPLAFTLEEIVRQDTSNNSVTSG